MINTALNKSDILYLLTQQEKLDTAMREQLEISEDSWDSKYLQHNLALNVELHEFINACFNSWKYWKRKDMNMDDVLDEAIDVIHFCMLMFNKSKSPYHVMADKIAIALEDRTSLNERSEVKLVMSDLSMHSNAVMSKLGSVLQILDYYGFTTLDILSAYNKKNQVNFERLNTGY